jgi:hypothetical protein
MENYGLRDLFSTTPKIESTTKMIIPYFTKLNSVA